MLLSVEAVSFIIAHGGMTTRFLPVSPLIEQM
jgi:hypothetical protein